MTRSAWVRILPFAAFMFFIGIQQLIQYFIDNNYGTLTDTHLLYLYPVKIIVVTALLLYLFRYYDELKFGDFYNFPHTLLSVFTGLIVFVLWINMDWPFATFGEAQGFNPGLVDDSVIRGGLIFFRIAGAALLVPVMEELFWRSFLLRYIINSDFEKVQIGAYTMSSFSIGSVLFGLEHNLVLAGVVAGAIYCLLLYKTKSLAQCVLAHGITNLALGIYVLQTQSWQFW